MSPIAALVLIAGISLLSMIFFFGYILPLLWKYLLKPLGKIAYFLILLMIGIGFFTVFFLGKHYGIPEPIQIGLGIFAAIIAGIKWAKKRY